MAGLLRLALHVVVIVVAASGADEERRREERSRAGANLLDGGDVVGERRGVDEDLLVESANSSAFSAQARGDAAQAPVAIGQWRLRAAGKNQENVLGSSGRHVVECLPCVWLMGCRCWANGSNEVGGPLRLMEMDGGPNWSAVIGWRPQRREAGLVGQALQTKAPSGFGWDAPATGRKIKLINKHFNACACVCFRCFLFSFWFLAPTSC